MTEEEQKSNHEATEDSTHSDTFDQVYDREGSEAAIGEFGGRAGMNRVAQILQSALVDLENVRDVSEDIDDERRIDVHHAMDHLKFALLELDRADLLNLLYGFPEFGLGAEGVGTFLMEKSERAHGDT
jgi:hypothetical protein